MTFASPIPPQKELCQRIKICNTFARRWLLTGGAPSCCTRKDDMAQKDDVLAYFQEKVGAWRCAVCANGGSQIAKIMQGLREDGYQFEETHPQRWDKRLFCSACGTKRTHYKLLSATPDPDAVRKRGEDLSRFRGRILGVIGQRDAFSGATISSRTQIDHKKPWIRLNEDYDVGSMSDAEIAETFQPLTSDHNLLKDRRCKRCVRDGVRPPFFGINFWYEGDEHYCGACKGCGWYDGAEWRRRLNEGLGHS